MDPHLDVLHYIKICRFFEEICQVHVMKKSNTTTTITTIFTIFLTTMSWQLLKEKYLIFKLLIAQIEFENFANPSLFIKKEIF